MKEKTTFRRIFVMLFFCGAFLTTKASELPVIRITTPDGAPVAHRQWFVSDRGFNSGITFELIDPNNPANNTYIDREIAERRDDIRGRGNSTWIAGERYGKKPYRIRFRNETSLMGMPAHRNWVLLANWFDATLGLRTAFAFELGARLGVPYTPSYHFVELYMNGVHQGVYLLTEHRQVCPLEVGAPGRPQVFYDNEGWMVEFDWRWNRVDDDPKFRTRRFNIPLVMKGSDFPFDPNNMSQLGDYTGDYDNFVVRDWRDLTDLLYCSTFPENGYRDLIDMQSIVNFFLVNVITNNVDFFVAHPRDGRDAPMSVFWHRRDGYSRIAAGPLWDFDLSFGFFIYNGVHTSLAGNTRGWYVNNADLQILGPAHRPYPTYPFFARFFDDPVFRAAWKESWNNNRDAILSMVDFIDETAAKIRESALRNHRIWEARRGQAVDFDLWVSRMRNYLVTRLAFLDEVYNRVNVFPTSRNFGFVNSENIPSQTFTLASFGGLNNLTKVFENGGAHFEVTPIIQTPTGNGGYLTTFTVRPNPDSPSGTHIDRITLSGTNQGNDFSFEIPLSVVYNNTTDLENTVVSVLQVYPNPFVNEVNIETAGKAEISLQIFDVAGVLVYAQRINAANKTLQLGHLPAGVYFFRFEENGNTQTIRVIKQ